jgi:hypothetical protein
MNSVTGASTPPAKRKADPRPVMRGIAVSLVFLVAFFLIQSRTGPLAEIPEAFLWFSLVPLVVGLFLGGYISGVKWGEIELAIPDALPKETEKVERQSVQVLIESKLAVQKAPEEASGTPAEPRAGSDDLRSIYAQEYERTQHYMLAHICRSIKPPADYITYRWFDVFIFVVRHQRGTPGPPATKLDEIKNAEFYLGPSWRNGSKSVDNKGRLIGIHTSAWGTFLCSCRLTFKDNRPPVVLYRFIDFYMDPGYREAVFPEELI